MSTRGALTLAITSLAMLGAARPLEAHPLHSTITELVADPARGTVRATVRVFDEDLRAAIARAAHRTLPPDGAVSDAAAFSYANATFAMRDARGRLVPLRSCGSRQAADLHWICLEALVGRDTGALQVRNAMLCDLFADQVNVVQGIVAGARRSLLFVRGDGFKFLR